MICDGRRRGFTCIGYQSYTNSWNTGSFVELSYAPMQLWGYSFLGPALIGVCSNSGGGGGDGCGEKRNE